MRRFLDHTGRYGEEQALRMSDDKVAGHAYAVTTLGPSGPCRAPM